MQKRKFTVVTQLHENNNTDLINYIEISRGIYAKALRESFYTVRNQNLFNKSRHNTYLQNKYGITKRTAGSIISDAQGRYNALKEIKQYEKKQLERKIAYLETVVIPELVRKRNDNSEKLRNKLPVSLIRQRNLRRKIVAKKSKLNRLKQRLDNLTWQLESGNIKLCFGTKHLLQRDYDKFIAQRDSQMTFVGTKTEKAGNQVLQLTHNPKNNQFILRSFMLK